MASAEVREKLVDALGLDLIGPNRDSEHLAELLPQAPSRWYLTGFLVPQDAPAEQREDVTASEGAEELGAGGGDDDPTAPEAAQPRRAFFPSSIGLSLLLPAAAKELKVTACWGEYHALDDKGVPIEDESEKMPAKWRRTDRHEELTLKIGAPGKPREFAVPNGDRLFLVLSVRPVHVPENLEAMLPAGTRSVSVFLVNRRKPAPDIRRDEGFIFQAALEVRSDVPLQPRPNLRGLETDDWDERVADLQYRDAFEYAVGHGVATHAVLDAAGKCREVHTCWIPCAEVERVAPAPIDGVELGMEALAKLRDGAEARARLIRTRRALPRVDRGAEGATAPTSPKKRKETAHELLDEGASVAANRIEAGIDAAGRSGVLDAFRIGQQGDGRRRPPAFQRHPAEGPGRGRGAGLAAVPARLPPDEPARHRRSGAQRPRGGRPAVLPDRRRQDGSVPRPGRLHPGLRRLRNPGSRRPG